LTLVAVLAAPLGVGYSLAYTPLTVATSNAANELMRANALSVLSMSLFVGGSVGAAVFTSVSVRGDASSADPAPFTTGFAVLAVPVVLALGIAALGRRRGAFAPSTAPRPTHESPAKGLPHDASIDQHDHHTAAATR
ncbi:MAG: hypothetical protein AAGG08_16635, partial [Actinomycetota bacterium]